MKVKMLAETTIGTEYVDGNLKDESIIGYYSTFDNIEDDSINLILIGGQVTVKRTESIIDFMIDNEYA